MLWVTLTTFGGVGVHALIDVPSQLYAAVVTFYVVHCQLNACKH